MFVNGKNTLVKDNASTPDIIDALLKAVPMAVDQCKNSIDYMIYKSGDPLIDAERCCRYIRSNVTYKADGFDEQNIQLPGRMFLKTKQADCKSFSLAFVGMMKALGHNVGFRFASYRKNKIPTHVYNFVFCNGKIYTFDSCVENLRESKKHTFIQDMKVQYLSAPITYTNYQQLVDTLARKGFTKQQIAEEIKRIQAREQSAQEFNTKPRTLLGKAARAFAAVQFVIPRNAFRTLVSFNTRGFATQLDRAVQKNKVAVKSFWEFFGGKFDGGDSLMQSINAGKNKKPLFGAKDQNKPGAKVGFYYDDSEDAYIGFDPVTGTTAAIAAATPIIVALKDLLKSLGVKPEDLKDLITKKEEGEGNKLPDVFPEYKPKNGIGFEPTPIMIAGIVGGLALVYFLVIKKKGKK
jgi:hypothetical protein